MSRTETKESSALRHSKHNLSAKSRSAEREDTARRRDDDGEKIIWRTAHVRFPEAARRRNSPVVSRPLCTFDYVVGTNPNWFRSSKEQEEKIQENELNDESHLHLPLLSTTELPISDKDVSVAHDEIRSIFPFVLNRPNWFPPDTTNIQLHNIQTIEYLGRMQTRHQSCYCYVFISGEYGILFPFALVWHVHPDNLYLGLRNCSNYIFLFFFFFIASLFYLFRRFKIRNQLATRCAHSPTPYVIPESLVYLLKTNLLIII
jgi:hypothetical protein